MSLWRLVVLTAVSAGPLGAVRHVADAYEAASRGVSGCRLTTHLVITAPLYHKTYDIVSYEVHQGSRPVKAVYARMSVDGREASKAEREAEEAKNNQRLAKREGEFFAPYDPAHLDEYTFKAGPEGTIAFTSRVRDTKHGDGRLTVDGAGELQQVDYTPSATASGAKGEVTIRFGRAGAWGPVVTGVQMAFKGAIGPLSGSMTLIQARDRHVRYASLEEGLSAIEKLR